MEGGCELVARPQSVWLVRDSLGGASAEIKYPTTELTSGPQTHDRNRLEVPFATGWGVPGGWQDVSVLGFEDLLLEEVLLV